MRPFGAMVKVERVRAALSQNELARRAGIDPAYLNRIERAAADLPTIPSRRIVRALVTALDVSAVEADRFLIAAGYCPEVMLRMSERQLRAIYTLLGEDHVEPAKLGVG